MKIIFLTFLTLFIPFGLFADVAKEKEISKILRDSGSYLSADVRAATEEEAYNEALRQLSDKVTDYFRESYSGDIPDGVYLSNLSGHYEKFSSHISNNRYRVVLYIKKSDLMPIGKNTNSVVLTKTKEDTYDIVSEDLPEAVIITETVVEVVEKPLSPTLSKLAVLSSEKEINEMLVSMRKSNEISGAAVFPIGNIGDFYLVVINPSERLEAILYCQAGQWKNVLTGQEVEMDNYKSCKAYWFTLP